MIVIEIKSIDKKKSRILTDEGAAFALYNGEISKLHIHEDDDIEQIYNTQILPILLKRARERVVYILKDMDKTEYDLRRKLKMSYYPEEIIDATMAWAKEHHYVDDVRYAKHFIESKSDTRSKRRLMQDLSIKGVDKDIIKQLLEEEAIDESEQIRKELSKRHYDRNSCTDKERTKIYAALARKGFSYDNIRSAMDE